MNGLHETIKERVKSGEIEGEEAAILTLSIALDIRDKISSVERQTVVWLFKNKPLQLAAILVLVHSTLTWLEALLPSGADILKLFF
jgi:hypothetical protein